MDVALFTGWCADAGRVAIPASPETVATFIDTIADTKLPSTVRRYASSIRKFHRAVAVPIPTETLAVKRMRRAKGGHRYIPRRWPAP